MLLLIPLVAASGCMGGDDERIEEWNTHVDAAHEHLDTADGLKDEGNEALQQEQYDLALAKYESAYTEYQQGLDDIEALEPVAEDLDRDYAVEFVDLWIQEVEAYLEQFEWNDKIIYALKFGEHYNTFQESFQQATQQYVDAVSYYNEGNYEAATSTANLSEDKWDDLIVTAESMLELAPDIEVDYVTQYATTLVELCDHSIKSLDFLKEAAYAASNEDWETADQMIGEQNVHDDAMVSNYNAIKSIESQHPNDFPEDGTALGTLIDEFVDKRDDAHERSLSFWEQRKQIVEEHDDFFEKHEDTFEETE
jgi:tetratricopeptide (TPR) repeat protein